MSNRNILQALQGAAGAAGGATLDMLVIALRKRLQTTLT